VDRHVEPHFDSAALITIDMQHDTLDGQALEVAGTSAIVTNLSELCAAFRRAGRPIVHIVRLYEADGANADACRRSLIESGAAILRPGSAGSQLASGLGPDGGVLDHERLLAGEVQSIGEREVVIFKPRWGAFYRTPLHAHLRASGVDTLVFGGCNFPNCPRTSIYEASERDYRLVLVRDAVSALYERGEQELVGIGVQVLASHEILSRLGR
jgi:nicotinamidase-related amidase